jgi:hypothetical protein
LFFAEFLEKPSPVIIYYFVNSLMTILAGIFLLKRKKTGLLFLLIVTILTFGSLEGSSADYNSLFLFTLFAPIALSFFNPAFFPMAVFTLFFVFAILLNVILNIKWINKKSKKSVL